MAKDGGPRLIWIFTPLVALSFAGFLLYLTTVPAGNDVDKVTQELNEQMQKAQQALKDKGKTLAEDELKEQIKSQLPEGVSEDTANKVLDNYQFFEILEKSEVKVEEVPEYKSTPKGMDAEGNRIQYQLRTGSFSSSDGADRQKAQLLLNGFSVDIQPAEVNGKTWYRVFTGPFANRSQMNKAQDQLVELGIKSVVIKQTIPKQASM
ncbi:hypothetical protein HF888_14915 [Bermanella marisrubri]|uniref:Sporulation related protein n=1 Tax=Bermanella marisrubri TaxID=207949 RepID=Q1N215_9GAMM|nr:SPOR domain-containing protein [Bermanella marisrubri]EAT12349.1 Sporulation related protein [Bermanella marisrubri]QIZ85432.1 hypothetical protein HF888_14915 [Bermanella marisrubri]